MYRQAQCGTSTQAATLLRICRQVVNLFSLVRVEFISSSVTVSDQRSPRTVQVCRAPSITISRRSSLRESLLDRCDRLMLKNADFTGLKCTETQRFSLVRAVNWAHRAVRLCCKAQKLSVTVTLVRCAEFKRLHISHFHRVVGL